MHSAVEGAAAGCICLNGVILRFPVQQVAGTLLCRESGYSKGESKLRQHQSPFILRISECPKGQTCTNQSDDIFQSYAFTLEDVMRRYYRKQSLPCRTQYTDVLVLIQIVDPGIRLTASKGEDIFFFLYSLWQTESFP